MVDGPKKTNDYFGRYFGVPKGLMQPWFGGIAVLHRLTIT